MLKKRQAGLDQAVIDIAWKAMSGRLKPAGSAMLKKRQAGLDQAVIDIAWKAQKRLYSRYCRMRARGKPQNVVIVALARELLGFLWSIGQQLGKKSA